MVKRVLLLAVGLVLVSAAGPHAQVTPSKATIEFVPTYTRYAQALRTKGASGLKDLLASGFGFHEGDRWARGKQALADIDEYASLFRGGSLSVRLRQVRVTGDSATVIVEEQGASSFNALTSGSAPVKGAGASMTVTMTWGWKHTWHRTPRGWKLAAIEKEPREVREDRPTLTVTSRP